jgi:hypothetical protein
MTKFNESMIYESFARKLPRHRLQAMHVTRNSEGGPAKTICGRDVVEGMGWMKGYPRSTTTARFMENAASKGVKVCAACRRVVDRAVAAQGRRA